MTDFKKAKSPPSVSYSCRVFLELPIGFSSGSNLMRSHDENEKASAIPRRIIDILRFDFIL